MRAAALIAVALVGLTLAGCGGDSEDAAAPSRLSSKASSKADPSDVAGVAWSPCDGVTAAQVSRLAGAPMAEQDGTTTQQRCTFTPVKKGGPAFDVNYLWFDGGLDAALDSIGASGAQLERVRVPGADAARLVVSPRRSVVLVTGFVQTAGLVQSVNAAQVAPYDEDAVAASTKRLLAALAEQAPSRPGPDESG